MHPKVLLRAYHDSRMLPSPWKITWHPPGAVLNVKHINQQVRELCRPSSLLRPTSIISHPLPQMPVISPPLLYLSLCCSSSLLLLTLIISRQPPQMPVISPPFHSRSLPTVELATFILLLISSVQLITLGVAVFKYAHAYTDNWLVSEYTWLVGLDKCGPIWADPETQSEAMK